MLERVVSGVAMAESPAPSSSPPPGRKPGGGAVTTKPQRSPSVRASRQGTVRQSTDFLRQSMAALGNALEAGMAEVVATEVPVMGLQLLAGRPAGPTPQVGKYPDQDVKDSFSACAAHNPIFEADERPFFLQQTDAAPHAVAGGLQRAEVAVLATLGGKHVSSKAMESHFALGGAIPSCQDRDVGGGCGLDQEPKRCSSSAPPSKELGPAASAVAAFLFSDG